MRCSRDRRTVRFLAVSLPYITVGIGLYLFQNGWLAIGIYHVGMILFLASDRSRSPMRVVLKGWRLKWAWLVVFCALSGLATYMLWPWMQQRSDLNTLLSRYHLTGPWWVAYVIYYSFFHPVLEELYWRGYLGHPSRNVRIEDAVFAGYHFFTLLCFIRWPGALLTFIILSATAWLWRQSVRETKGLLMPALAHTAAAISISAAASVLLISS